MQSHGSEVGGAFYCFHNWYKYVILRINMFMNSGAVNADLEKIDMQQ